MELKATSFASGEKAARALGLIFYGHYFDRRIDARSPDLFTVVTRPEGKVRLMRVSEDGDRVAYPVTL